jgi:thermitase
MIPKDPNARNEMIAEGEWQDRAARYRRNRLVVKFKPPAGDDVAAVARAAADVSAAIPGGAVVRAPSHTGRAVFSVDPSADVIALAKEISARDDVEYAEPDIVDHIALVPSDTRFVDQWGLTKIGAPAAWDLEQGKSNVLIGIIDSGISMTGAGALDHPDLDNGARYILGTDFVDGGTPRDLNGHGTHVAGIAGAESNNASGVAGVNWNSLVYVCRTLDAAGNGSAADFADAVEEIVDYAVANNLKAVINYSGGGGPGQVKQDACQYAHDRGMILCAATGNDNAGPVIFPAAYSTMFAGVIAVGSTDANDKVSGFSNVGPEVTVVAPGSDILSTMPTYAVSIPAALNFDTLSGTSMATPCVTGLVALMWSRHPGFSNAKIRDCLTQSAVKLGRGNFNNAWGFGRVDAEKALRCGDLVFPTRFTVFTRFTIFTDFTKFTWLTKFTRFTFLTPFTDFTWITRFTGDPPPFEVDPLIRVGKLVFGLSELEIRRFGEFEGAVEPLSAIGVTYLHELLAADTRALAKALHGDAKSAHLLQLDAERVLAGMSEQSRARS